MGKIAREALKERKLRELLEQQEQKRKERAGRAADPPVPGVSEYDIPIIETRRVRQKPANNVQELIAKLVYPCNNSAFLHCPRVESRGDVVNYLGPGLSVVASSMCAL